MDAETHRRFVEEDLTGLDIMPFAAHLAVVQLALRNPTYITDRVRIAVYDSTSLRPGTKIRPLERVMPQGQASIHHFHQEEVEKRKVRAGAVSGAGAGRGFTVGRVEVVIMNPPFTRKQHVKPDFRAMLTSRFEDYREIASKESNLFGYFMLLADRFLVPGGRMAMVLPSSFLRQLSSAGIRGLLAERYVVEYIIQSGYRLAFSESSAFREILLVARMRESGLADRACVTARLDAMPDESNVGALATLLRNVSDTGRLTPELESRAGKLGIVLSVLPPGGISQASEWQHLLPGERIEGFELPESPALAPLSQVAARVVQGIRFHAGSDQVDVKNTVLSRERDVGVKMNWRIERETDSEVEAVSTESGARVRIPKSVLRPTSRSPAGMPTMEIVDPLDYIVVGRFAGDEAFWDDLDPEAILRRRLPHLENREACLIAAGRNNVNLAANGTHFLGFVAPQPVPPTWSFWSIKTASLDEARLLALWWNSTFHLVQLMENRTEVGGPWMGWLKDDLLRLKVLNPASLSPSAKRELLRTWDEWKATPFPPLLEQLRSHFEGRIAIDSAIARALGASPADLRLPVLYDALTARIESLRDLLTRR